MLAAARKEHIRAYKAMLKDAVEACPAGTRLRIADLIGKNKSFVSQVTNPNYLTPLPECYIEPILAVVDMGGAEQGRFRDLYRRAHPCGARSAAKEPTAGPDEMRVVRIEVPRLPSRRLEAQVDRMIAQMARDISALVKNG